jgi:hypothetical protein
MERILLTSQYKTSPDGKFIKMKVKKMGMNIIILACAGSPGGGDIFCWKNMEAPMIMVSTGIP